MAEFVSRYYNSLELVGDKVVKTGPADRIKREVDWFVEAGKYCPGCIPQTSSLTAMDNGRASYSLEYIEGGNLYEHMQKQGTNEDVLKANLSRIAGIFVNQLHTGSQPVGEDDIENMYLTKPLKSLEFAKQYSFGRAETYEINGTVYEHPAEILRNKYSLLRDRLMDIDYKFMHGDTTFGNVLIGQNESLYLIDPRGAFGDPRYDYAKTIFSFWGGFSALNVGRYKVGFTPENQYNYIIESLTTDPTIKSDFLKQLDCDEEIVDFIHATIWLSLLPHVDDLDDNVLCSFLQGTVLIND